MRALLILQCLLLSSLLALPSASHSDSDCVVLLHGLARSASSMEPIANALETAGYAVSNVGYASRSKTIEKLAVEAIEKGMAGCETQKDSQVHFVTHSLGGILIRFYLSQSEIERLGRVVMLAPPNQGSEVVDNWKGIPGYSLINGPAGIQLGTDSESVPRSLGPVTFPVGVIAGNKTFNPILSLSLPNPDDGKVSVESTKVAGMTDFLVVPHTHTFIMQSDEVIRQVLYFLQNGEFAKSDA